MKEKKGFKSLLQVFKSKWLYVNILVALILAFILIWLSLAYLDSFTRHQERITVPSLKGMTVDEAESVLQGSELRYWIMDSAFYPALRPFEIIAQNPDSGELVKRDRTIYLSVNATKAPLTDFPEIDGKSLRSAKTSLKNNGFNIDEEEIVYKAYPYVDVVISAEVGGKRVLPGSQFPKGTEVRLYVGNGLGSTRVGVPELFGSSLKEAEFILQGAYELNIGLSSFHENVLSVEDSVNAVIYKQNPAPTREPILRWGEFIDVWLMKKEVFQDLVNDGVFSAPGYDNPTSSNYE